jgi:hypothetical protein
MVRIHSHNAAQTTTAAAEVTIFILLGILALAITVMAQIIKMVPMILL